MDTEQRQTKHMMRGSSILTYARLSYQRVPKTTTF